MICCGKPRVPLKIRFIGVVLLLTSLLTFGRFSVEAAATAHLSTSVVVGVLSIVATIAVLDLSRRDLIVTFLPGLMLAGVFGVVILATNQMRAELEPTVGLGATVGLLAVVWLVAMVLGIQRKILVFPKP